MLLNRQNPICQVASRRPFSRSTGFDRHRHPVITADLCLSFTTHGNVGKGRAIQISILQRAGQAPPSQPHPVSRNQTCAIETSFGYY